MSVKYLLTGKNKFWLDINSNSVDTKSLKLTNEITKIDLTIGADSDDNLVTQKGIKTYVDSVSGSVDILSTQVSCAGVISGFDYTDHADGTITINTGVCILRKGNLDTDDTQQYTVSASCALDIAVDDCTYIYVDWNNGTPFIGQTLLTSVLDNENSAFELYAICRESGTTLHITKQFQYAQNVNKRVQRLFYDINDHRRTKGLIPFSSGRHIEITTGTLWVKLNEIILPAYSSLVTDFSMYYGSAHTKVPAQSEWDNLQYSLNGVLTALGGGIYSFQEIYLETDGDVGLIYAQNFYSTLAACESADVITDVPSRFIVHGLYAGRICFKQADVTPQSVLNPYETQLNFESATDHNNLSNLSADAHLQYALLSGRSGSQILYGGTDPSDDLTLGSTSNATKGTISLDSVEINESIVTGVTGMEIILDSDECFCVDAETNPRTITDAPIRTVSRPTLTGSDAIKITNYPNSITDTRSLEIILDTEGTSSPINPKILNITADVNGVTNMHLDVIKMSMIGVIDGTSSIHAIDINGAGVVPIHHHTGTSTQIEQAWTYNSSAFADATTAFSIDGTNITLFPSVNDEIYIGMSAPFTQVDIILDTNGSNPGINPEWSYSRVGDFNVIAVTDNTNGFRQSGTVFPTSSPGDWVAQIVNGVSKFYVKCKRQSSGLGTKPIESTIKVTASALYSWDENGDISINDLNCEDITADGTIYGGSSASDSLVLKGTSDATPGFIQMENPVNMVNATIPPSSHTPGAFWYDTDNDTISFMHVQEDVISQFGQENHVQIRNETGGTLNNGSVLYALNVVTGKTTHVQLADASDDTKARVIGILTHNVDTSNPGLCTTSGRVNDINTTGCAAGSPVYLSATIPGAFTTTPPICPNYIIRVGICLVEHGSTGSILVDLGIDLSNGVRIKDLGAIDSFKTDSIVEVTTDAGVLLESVHFRNQQMINCDFISLGHDIPPLYSTLHIKKATRPGWSTQDDTDAYPTAHFWSESHDNMGLCFDCYNDSGTVKSSDASNLIIQKIGNGFNIGADSGVSTGNAVSFENYVEMLIGATMSIGSFRIGSPFFNTNTYTTDLGAERPVVVDSNGRFGYNSCVRRVKGNEELLTILQAEKLYDIPVKKYQRRVIDYDTNTPIEGEFHPRICYGFIAEDCFDVEPDICIYDDELNQESIAGIQQQSLLAMAIKLIQQQKETIDDLTARVTALENLSI